MIFSPELAAKVLSGEKTVTRRLLRHRDGRPVSYKAGGIYAVQTGRGYLHIGHIRLTAIQVENMGGLTEEEARLEGFENRSAFIDYWRALHGSYLGLETVIRIRFERAPSCERCAT